MINMTANTWHFNDDDSFQLDAPHGSSYLYFPLMNAWREIE